MKKTDNMIACETVDNRNLHLVFVGIPTGIITLGDILSWKHMNAS